jgi:hypothetical protein
MDARTREREVEKAWIQHDPARGKITNEAWRALRQFKRSIAPQAARVGLASDDRKRIRELMYDYSRKGDVGAQRTFAKLRHHFHPATVERLQKGILWSWLDPRGAMLADAKDVGETQDAILVRYGLAWVVKKRHLAAYEAFTLEAPDHALARMLQRSPGTDIREALHQAHHHLFKASASAVGRHVEEQTRLYLPCGPGLLICEALRASTPSGLVYVFCRGRTWISADMVRPDQTPIAAAPSGVESQLTIMSMMALHQAEED